MRVRSASLLIPKAGMMMRWEKHQATHCCPTFSRPSVGPVPSWPLPLWELACKRLGVAGAGIACRQASTNKERVLSVGEPACWPNGPGSAET